MVSVEAIARKPDSPQWRKTEELVTLSEIAFALQAKIKTLPLNSPEGKAMKHYIIKS